MYVYRKGITTGRPIPLHWSDFQGTVIDFSSGYTFAGYIVDISAPSVLVGTKSTGITGYATAALGYNVLIDWASADFSSLTAGRDFSVTLVATPSGGDPYAFPGGPIRFRLEAAPV